MKRSLVRILLVFGIGINCNQISYAQENQIYLWNHPENFQDKNKIESGVAEHINNPFLVIYKPIHPNHIALIITSGGGYAREELQKEGIPTAKYFQNLGFTVFELIYRLPNQDQNSGLSSFADEQRAIRIVRSNAPKFAIHPQKIGLLGFSAGAHLAGMVTTQFNFNFYTPKDNIDQASARPDFTALLYPIISMQTGFEHTNSYKTLIGNQQNQNLRDFYSVNLHVNHQTPPIFLAHALDDKISPVQNSLLMQDALKKHKINYQLELYKQGGHGWGMGNHIPETHQWPIQFIKWLKQIKMINQ